jgi:hypothetical protein
MQRFRDSFPTSIVAKPNWLRVFHALNIIAFVPLIATRNKTMRVDTFHISKCQPRLIRRRRKGKTWARDFSCPCESPNKAD